MARAVRVRLELDNPLIRAVAASMVAPRVNETTTAILTRSKANTPVRTGTLRASQRKTMRVRRTAVIGTVETRIKYATWVHEGTRAHIIRARPGGTLRFVSHGEVVYRKMVHHPGTRPRPFMRDALYQEAPRRGFRVTGGATGFLTQQFDG